MILEKILYCASSALVSAVATFSFTRFLQRRNKPEKQVAEPSSKTLATCTAEPLEEPNKDYDKSMQKSTVSDYALEEKEKQLLAALSKVKGLESEIASLKEDKEAAEDTCQDLEERLSETCKVAKEAKHQLGKSKYAQKQVEDSFAGLLAEKETALDKIQALRREKADAQKSETECRNSVTGLQRTLSTQTNDRKSAEKLAKRLENELIEVRASRSRLELHYKSLLQKLEEKLQKAESEKETAQKDLNRHLSQLSTARQKVTEFGGDYLRMQQEYAICQDKLRTVNSQLQNETHKHAETTQGLKTAIERIRELEKELRITKETARNQLKRSMSSLSSGSSSSQQQMSLNRS